MTYKLAKDISNLQKRYKWPINQKFNLTSTIFRLEKIKNGTPLSRGK